MGGKEMRFTYGFEIEIERFYDRKISLYRSLEKKGYSIKDDGSLRNGGKEVVSPVIERRTELKRRLKQVLFLLEKHKCVPSYRTGIHIHVGTFNDEKEVYEYLKTYLMYERQIFDIYPERKYNNFCVPILDSDLEDLDYVSKIENGELFYDFLVNSWGKYSALNIAAFPYFRTVEYRVPVTEFDTKRLFEFLDIVFSINNIFNRRKPLLEPREEDILEVNEFLLMAKNSFYNYIPVDSYKTQKLFGLIKEEEEDIEYLVDEVIREMEV